MEQFSGEKRVRYFDGQLLSAADFRDEQTYLIRKRHRHNQTLHGPGVVAGLSVTISSDTSPSVIIEPGMAFDRLGRELELLAPAAVTLADLDSSQYVIVEYAERETDPVPLGSGRTGTAASRVEEGVLISLCAQDTSGDGIAIGRVVFGPTGWKTDNGFELQRAR